MVLSTCPSFLWEIPFLFLGNFVSDFWYLYFTIYKAGGGGTADINPASYDSGSWGEAGGIAGFTDNGEAGNFTALKNFAAQKGKNWTDLQTQCEFLIYQMSHGTWWGAYNTPTCVEMNEQGYTVQHAGLCIYRVSFGKDRNIYAVQ